MASEDANKKPVTTKQLVLIGVLAVALIGVVYNNFLSGEDPSSEFAAVQSSTKNSTATNRKSSKKKPTTILKTIDSKPLAPWPKYNIKNISKHDPLALPYQFPQPKVFLNDEDDEQQKAIAAAALAKQKLEQEQANRLAAIDTLVSTGAQIVLSDGNQMVAMINGKEIHIGDTLEGLTVVHIGANGVTLEEKAAK